MSQSNSSLDFQNYLLGGVKNTTNLWQQINTNPQNNITTRLNLTKISSTEENKYLYANLSALCYDTLGIGLASIEYPGGKQRSSYRLILENGQSLIVSRRNEVGRAVLEERVLRHLIKHNAPVPKILSFNGLVLLQEDMGNQRLSNALDGVDESTYTSLLSKALNSLLSIHKAGNIESLERYVPILGSSDEWLTSFIDRPIILGNYLNITPPTPDLDNIYDLLTLFVPHFVKWDARPGNAILTAQQEVIWFDWEHCGARNRLDDLLWVMCDETTPYFPNAENDLLAHYIPYFTDGLSVEHAYSYCRVFGMLHCCTRLSFILSEQEENGWGDYNKLLQGDKVGTTLEQAQRLCQRASDWCQNEPMINVLSPWFLDISAELERS